MNAAAAAPALSTANAAAVHEESRAYLASLLNKNLLVHTTDGRMFRGEFKCTDPVGSLSLSRAAFFLSAVGSVLTAQERNIVLAHTTEYRQPTARQRAQHAAEQAAAGEGRRVALNMTSRYVGLVVAPGEHIVKIELEEFTSQQKVPAGMAG